jgi:hypothetical protein
VSGPVPDPRTFGRITADGEFIVRRFPAYEFVGREWLFDLADDIRSARRQMILVGEPGAGKSTFAARIAELWNCPRHFIRADNMSGVSGTDARSFLVRIGAQLREKYGPEIFQHAIKGSTQVTVGWAGDRAQVTGRVIDELYQLPFLENGRDVKVRVGVATSGAVVYGERIHKVYDLSLALEPRTLLHAAVLWPLEQLYSLYPEERVVLVIDALDEARQGGGILDVIPKSSDAAFPRNLALLMTSRHGSHLAAFPADDLIDLNCNLYREDRRRDTLAYIRRRAGEEPLRDAFELWDGERRRRWTSRVAEESQDNALYLYHFFNEAAQAVRAGDGQLNRLPVPKGLDEIYRFFAVERIRRGLADTVQLTASVPVSQEMDGRLHALPGVQSVGVEGAKVTILCDDANAVLNAVLASRFPIAGVEIRQGAASGQWEETYLPVLGVLAVCREPLERETIAGFARVKVEFVDSILAQIEQFLRERDRCWRFYHPSFAEYLLDAARNRDFPIDGRASHRRIAAYYGGQQLEQVAVEPFTPADEYAHRHLSAHLLQAEEQDVLFALVDNRGWFEAQRSRNPSQAQYLNDLEQARQAAETEDDAAIARSEHGPLLHREVWCALAASSVRSLLSQMPVELLDLAIDTGLWPASWALVAARQFSEGFLRFEALLTVAARLGVDERERVVREALEQASEHRSNLAGYLSELAPYARILSERDLQTCLDLVRSGGDPSEKARQLKELAAFAPAEWQEGLTAEITAAARELEDPEEQAEAQPDGSEKLAAIRELVMGTESRSRMVSEFYDGRGISEEEAEEALAASLAVPWVDEPAGPFHSNQARGRALTAVARILSGRFLQAAITASRELGEPDRNYALAAAAKRLAETGLPTQGIELTREIADDFEAVKSLAEIGEKLVDEADFGACLNAAVRSGDAPHPWVRWVLAVRLAELGRSDRAIALARSIDSLWHKANALAGVAAALREPPDRKLVHEALSVSADDAVQSMLSSADEGTPLMRMAQRLARDGRYEEAQAAARSFPMLAEALTTVAKVLPGEMRKEVAREALAAGQRVGDGRARIEVILRCLGNYRPPVVDLDDLLADTLKEIKLLNSNDRATAVATIGPMLPDSLRHRAIEAARDIEDTNWRLHALAKLWQTLPESASQGLESEVTQLAESEEWGSDRLDGFCTFVALLDANRQRAVLQRMTRFPRGIARVGSLLSEEVQREAVAVARAFENPRDRVIALSGLAPVLPEEVQREVLGLIREEIAAMKPDPAPSRVTAIKKHLRRMWGVENPADLLPIFLRHLADAVVPEAIALAREIDDKRERAPVLLEIGFRVTELGRLEMALELAADLDWAEGDRSGSIPSLRAAIVLGVLVEMPDARRRPLVRTMLRDVRRIPAEAARGFALAALVPFVDGWRRAVLFRVVLACANRGASAEERAAVFRLVLPEMPQELADETRQALERAFREIYFDDQLRAGLLNDMARRTASLPMTKICDLWRQSVPAIAARRRESAIADLPSVIAWLFQLGGDWMATAVTQAVADVGRRWP